MADTGFIFPGTMVANRTIASGTVDWTDPDNAKADDATTAKTTVDGVNTISRGLAASNFGFASLIPVGSSIQGIEVQVGDYISDLGAPTFGTVRLILADDTDGAENKTLLAFSTSLQTDQAGGTADLWTEGITRADVVDVDFGFFIGAVRDGGSRALDIDFMQMKIFYTEPAAVLPGFNVDHYGIF